MNKKDIIINISPFVWWMLCFVIGILGFSELDMAFYIQMIGLLLLPIFISIYNTISSDDCDDLCLKSVFMGTSNIVGIIFSSAFSNSFVKHDTELESVLFLFLGLTFIYTLLLTLICCGVKKLFGKFIKEKQKSLKMPEWNEVVELLHDKELVFSGFSVEKVIYSKDKSKRCIVLKSDNGFYTYRFEQIYQYTEEEWIYFGNDSDAVPGFWTDVESRNTSIFSSMEEAVKELEHEAEYKTYFS